MKVFLFCAGKGERLGEVTKTKPKCLISIGGRPILQRWLDSFKDWHVSDILINVHHCSDAVMDYIRDADIGSLRISISKEKELLGTAKTLYQNKRFVKGEHCFAIVYSDVWTTFDIRKMLNYHKKRSYMVTMALYAPKSLEGKGVAIIKEGMVVGFEEKPKNPKSKFVWSGILIAHPSIFNLLEPGMTDIARDLLPKIAELGKVNAFYVNDPLVDIGTPEGLKEANEIVGSIGLKAL